MSCVVTRDLDQQPPPNFPASVVGTQEWPTDRILPVVREETTGTLDGGLGGAMEVVITAIVRDPNIEDDLEGLVFVNRDPDIPGMGLEREIDIPANGAYEREVTLPGIPFGRLQDGCNVIELQVSRQFSNFPALEPGVAIGGIRDLGVGQWFIAVRPTADDPDPSVSGCQ